MATLEEIDAIGIHCCVASAGPLCCVHETESSKPVVLLLCAPTGVDEGRLDLVHWVVANVWMVIFWFTIVELAAVLESYTGLTTRIW